ncbi:MAG: hypothetical protein QOF97_2739, partial [Acidimicrobiaceae bacterium]
MTKLEGSDPIVPLASESPELAAAAVAETEVPDAAESKVETLRDYMRVVYVRILSGDSGVLPVVAGLLLISILFQYLNSNFLTSGNLVNLLIQGAVYMLLAMGE